MFSYDRFLKQVVTGFVGLQKPCTELTLLPCYVEILRKFVTTSLSYAVFQASTSRQWGEHVLRRCHHASSIQPKSMVSYLKRYLMGTLAQLRSTEMGASAAINPSFCYMKWYLNHNPIS